MKAFKILGKPVAVPVVKVTTSLLLSLTAGQGYAQAERNLRQETANKTIVIQFVNHLLGDKDLSQIDRLVAPDYIQHNPEVADGREALKAAAARWFAGMPKEQVDIQHIAAENDLVFMHIRRKAKDGKVLSVMDIFRLKNSQIVEHWDVIQAVPEESANKHPMF